MSQSKRKTKVNHTDAAPVVYPTWEAFVQAKVDRAKVLLGQIDQDALRRLIEAKKQFVP